MGLLQIHAGFLYLSFLVLPYDRVHLRMDLFLLHARRLHLLLGVVMLCYCCYCYCSSLNLSPSSHLLDLVHLLLLLITHQTLVFHLSSYNTSTVRCPLSTAVTTRRTFTHRHGRIHLFYTSHVWLLL